MGVKEDRQYLMERLLQSHKDAGRDYYVDQLDRRIATGLADFMRQAEGDGYSFSIMSGARTTADQARARGQARPGYAASLTGSYHVRGGNAVDVKGPGGRSLTADEKQYMRDNLPTHGLHQPIYYNRSGGEFEPWHVEPWNGVEGTAGTRAGRITQPGAETVLTSDAIALSRQMPEGGPRTKEAVLAALAGQPAETQVAQLTPRIIRDTTDVTHGTFIRPGTPEAAAKIQEAVDRVETVLRAYPSLDYESGHAGLQKQITMEEEDQQRLAALKGPAVGTQKGSAVGTQFAAADPNVVVDRFSPAGTYSPEVTQRIGTETRTETVSHTPSKAEANAALASKVSPGINYSELTSQLGLDPSEASSIPTAIIAHKKGLRVGKIAVAIQNDPKNLTFGAAARYLEKTPERFGVTPAEIRKAGGVYNWASENLSPGEEVTAQLASLGVTLQTKGSIETANLLAGQALEKYAQEHGYYNPQVVEKEIDVEVPTNVGELQMQFEPAFTDRAPEDRIAPQQGPSMGTFYEENPQGQLADDTAMAKYWEDRVLDMRRQQAAENVAAPAPQMSPVSAPMQTIKGPSLGTPRMDLPGGRSPRPQMSPIASNQLQGSIDAPSRDFIPVPGTAPQMSPVSAPMQTIKGPSLGTPRMDLPGGRNPRPQMSPIASNQMQGSIDAPSRDFIRVPDRTSSPTPGGRDAVQGSPLPSTGGMRIRPASDDTWPTIGPFNEQTIGSLARDAGYDAAPTFRAAPSYEPQAQPMSTERYRGNVQADRSPRPFPSYGGEGTYPTADRHVSQSVQMAITPARNEPVFSLRDSPVGDWLKTKMDQAHPGTKDTPQMSEPKAENQSVVTKPATVLQPSKQAVNEFDLADQDHVAMSIADELDMMDAGFGMPGGAPAQPFYTGPDAGLPEPQGWQAMPTTAPEAVPVQAAAVQGPAVGQPYVPAGLPQPGPPGSAGTIRSDRGDTLSSRRAPRGIGVSPYDTSFAAQSGVSRARYENMTTGQRAALTRERSSGSINQFGQPKYTFGPSGSRAYTASRTYGSAADKRYGVTSSDRKKYGYSMGSTKRPSAKRVAARKARDSARTSV